MDRVVVGVLVGLVVLAGCSGLPGRPAPADPTAGELAPPYVVFANDDTLAYEVTVYLTAGPIERFRVGFGNGTSRVVDAGNVPYAATSIEPATDVAATGAYTVAPGETLGLALRGCGADTGVWMVYAPANQPTAFSWIQTTTCEGLTLLEERNRNGGGSYTGGAYTDRLEGPDTVRRTLSAEG